MVLIKRKGGDMNSRTGEEKKPDYRIWKEILRKKIQLNKKGAVNPKPRTDIENIMLLLHKTAGAENSLNR